MQGGGRRRGRLGSEARQHMQGQLGRGWGGGTPLLLGWRRVLLATAGAEGRASVVSVARGSVAMKCLRPGWGEGEAKRGRCTCHLEGGGNMKRQQISRVEPCCCSVILEIWFICHLPLVPHNTAGCGSL